MSAANPQGEAQDAPSHPSFSANTRKSRFSEAGFFVPGVPSFRTLQPLQAHLGLAAPSRHSPALVLSWVDIPRKRTPFMKAHKHTDSNSINTSG